MREFVFVLEQTLGHVAHAQNILRSLDRHSDSIRATVIPIEFRRTRSIAGQIPGLNTWTVEASRQARSRVRERLRQRPADALFIHTQVAAIFAGALMQRIPAVVSLDATPVNFDSQGVAYGHGRSSPAVEAVKRRLNRRVFERAAALVAWCRWAADSLVADYGVPAGKVTVIHPGVDIHMFRPAPRPPRSPVRLLFVGGDFERKGGGDLLAALRRVGRAVEVDVVTGSPVEVPPGVVCRVHRGLRPQAPELVQLYREADVFALPSRGDCFPQAVAEALASGLPIIGSTVGAIPEMIREGVNGITVPPGDPRRLGEAIEALAQSASRRAQLGAASRKLAEAEHDAEANNHRIFELMAAVASRPASSRLIA